MNISYTFILYFIIFNTTWMCHLKTVSGFQTSAFHIETIRKAT